MRLDVPAAATIALQYGWLGFSPLWNSFENIFSILHSLLKRQSVLFFYLNLISGKLQEGMSS
jgi:hypothetical protein